MAGFLYYTGSNIFEFYHASVSYLVKRVDSCCRVIVCWTCSSAFVPAKDRTAITVFAFDFEVPLPLI